GTAWERYYAEVMFPWDFKVWIGKWNFDWEADDKIIYAQELHEIVCERIVVIYHEDHAASAYFAFFTA
uniref:hypothetical protein n=1 Tax=Acetomicrobium sp. S15 = DSM 107314 TaxID=2529858 RepID=UPI0018E1C898